MKRPREAVIDATILRTCGALVKTSIEKSQHGLYMLSIYSWPELVLVAFDSSISYVLVFGHPDIINDNEI